MFYWNAPRVTGNRSRVGDGEEDIDRKSLRGSSIWLSLIMLSRRIPAGSMTVAKRLRTLEQAPGHVENSRASDQFITNYLRIGHRCLFCTKSKDSVCRGEYKEMQLIKETYKNSRSGAMLSPHGAVLTRIQHPGLVAWSTHSSCAPLCCVSFLCPSALLPQSFLLLKTPIAL